MSNKFYKIGVYICLSVLITMNLVFPVFAQQDIFSPLQDIKSTLAEDDISVIDYSNPEGEWGTLNKTWRTILINEGYESLKDYAETFDNFYNETDGITDGIIDLRRQLEIAEALKTRELSKEDREEASADILTLKGDIDKLETDIRGLIALELTGILPTTDEMKDKLQGIEIKEFNEVIQTGVNAIFHEVNFLYSYNKWGRVPLRAVIIIENNTPDSVVDLNSLFDLEKYNHDIEAMKDDLRGMEHTVINTLGKEEIQRLTDNDIELIISEVLGRSSYGENQLHRIAREIASVLRNLIGGLAIIWIIIAGVRMILAQGDESVITEQKNSITYAIIGLIAILLVERMIDILLGAPYAIHTSLVEAQAKGVGFSVEIYGLINYIKSVVGMLAIFYIMLSGLNTILAQGEEEEIKKQRKSILWVLIGLVLIGIDKILVENFFIVPAAYNDEIGSSNITAIINLLGRIAQFILGFVGLIAFGMLIYGAAYMIINYGDDEMVEEAKKIIKNAIIGIVIVMSAYTLVATLVVFK